MAKVTVLSQHQCNPREGQFNALYRIFLYLKCEISCDKNTTMGSLMYDDHQTEVDDRFFLQSAQDQWNYFILTLRSYYRQRYHQELCVCTP